MYNVNYILKILTPFLLIFNPIYSQKVNPENIEIIRDNYGVPHVYSKTDKELASSLSVFE